MSAYNFSWFTKLGVQALRKKEQFLAGATRLYAGNMKSVKGNRSVAHTETFEASASVVSTGVILVSNKRSCF